jgi:hypothetical protein
MPNDIPLGGGGWRDFIPPFVWNWLLEGNLLSNPFPYFFGRISKEGGKLWPPPTSMVIEKLIKFLIEQVEFSFVAPHVRLSTLSCVIQPSKSIGGIAFLVFGLMLVRI